MPPAGFRNQTYRGDSDMNKYITGRLMGALALALVIAQAAVPGLLARAASLSIVTVASTVPSNGDVNPYGVAVVPASIGKLVKGHILVSNFNNSANLQGTGTTIMDIAPVPCRFALLLKLLTRMWPWTSFPIEAGTDRKSTRLNSSTDVCRMPSSS